MEDIDPLFRSCFQITTEKKKATDPLRQDGRWITVNGLWSLQVCVFPAVFVVSPLSVDRAAGKVEEKLWR